MLIAWLAAALGVLTKGLVAAAIPAGVLVLYSLRMRAMPRRGAGCMSSLRLAAVSCDHRSLALACGAAAAGFPAVLLHARAFGALFDAECRSRRDLVVLRRGVPARQRAVDARRVASHGPGMAAAHGAGGIQSRAFSLDLGAVRVRVLFALRFETHSLHFAGDAGARLADCRLADAGAATRCAAHGVLDRASRRSLLALLCIYGPQALRRRPIAAPISSRSPSRSREVAALLAASGLYVLSQRRRDVTRRAVFLGVGWCLSGLLLMRAAAAVAPVYSGVRLARALPVVPPETRLYYGRHLRSNAAVLLAAHVRARGLSR